MSGTSVWPWERRPVAAPIERAGREQLGWCGAGLLTGLVILAAVVHFPLHPVLAAAAVMALMGASAIVLGSPALGACALIVIIYWNASDVITDATGFSWVLRLALIGVVGIWALQQLSDTTPTTSARWPLLGPMLAYGAVLVASSLGATDMASAQAALIEFGKGVVAFYLTVQLLNRPRSWRWGIQAIVAAAMLLSLPVMYQGITGSHNTFWGFGSMHYDEIVPGQDGWRLGGAMGDPNFLAMVLVAALPLALVTALESPAPWWRRLWGMGVAALILGATVFTYSRGAAVGLAVVVVAVLWKYRQRRLPWVLLAAGLIALPVLAPSGLISRMQTLTQVSLTRQQQSIVDSSFQGRRNEYLTGLLMAWHHPLLGVGTGNYEANYLKYAAMTGLATGDRIWEPHSLPVQMLAETGLAGVMAFGFLVWAGFSLMEKARRRMQRIGAGHYADWLWALELSVATYLVLSLFLHGAYFRHFWLLLSLGALGATLAYPPSAAAKGREFPGGVE